MSSIPQLRAETGYIYMVRCHHYYKIGKSANPQDRLENIRINNPYPVRLIRTFPTFHTTWAEQCIHRQLAIYHEHGEWFVLPGDVIGWLLSIIDIDAFFTNTETAPPTPPNEQACLEMALVYRARGATKQKAIEAAFGIRKGGSTAYRRASQLFDLASAPALAAQQQPRWEPDTDHRQPV